MTDMDFVFNLEGKSKATYKFVPIMLDSDLNIRPNYLLGSISLSSGQYENKLFLYNTATQERCICSIEDGIWSTFNYSPLSPFELSVLALSAEGMSVSEIAVQVHKAVDTVKSARKRIFSKLNVPNITKAIICGINHKII